MCSRLRPASIQVAENQAKSQKLLLDKISELEAKVAQKPQVNPEVESRLNTALNRVAELEKEIQGKGAPPNHADAEEDEDDGEDDEQEGDDVENQIVTPDGRVAPRLTYMIDFDAYVMNRWTGMNPWHVNIDVMPRHISQYSPMEGIGTCMSFFAVST